MAPTDLEIARTESILDEGLLLIGLLIAIAAAYLVNEGLASNDDLFSRIGFGKLAPRAVLDRVLDAEPLGGPVPSGAAPHPRKVCRSRNSRL